MAQAAPHVAMSQLLGTDVSVPLNGKAVQALAPCRVSRPRAASSPGGNTKFPEHLASKLQQDSCHTAHPSQGTAVRGGVPLPGTAGC